MQRRKRIHMISVILACMLMLESPAVSMAAVQPEKSETVVMTSAAAAGTASKTSGKVRMVILAASGGIVKRRRLPMEQWFCPRTKTEKDIHFWDGQHERIRQEILSIRHMRG